MKKNKRITVDGEARMLVNKNLIAPNGGNTGVVLFEALSVLPAHWLKIKNVKISFEVQEGK